MYGQITGCRICGSEWLEVLLELGTQFLTGVFPRTPDESLTKGPLTLVRCDECGLVQLLYSYERTELYGAHYGYRSSLNRTMVNHLEAKAQMLMRTVDLRPDDVIVDVGSNDGTLLSFFSGRNLCLLGFDPSAERWRGGYPDDSRLIADFFSAELYLSALGQRERRVVPSIPVFCDLERPSGFDSLRPFKEVRDSVRAHKGELGERLEALRARGESVLGYGASTKGNVILQFTGIDRALLPAIAEVNADKFGCVTPGTWIPIISETEARARKPDYFLVFPWHFRTGLIEREAAFLAAGGKLMFPLPSIEVVSTSRR